MAGIKNSTEIGLVDCIEVKDMEFAGYLGVTQAERSRPQPIFIDLQMFLDLTRAGQTDKIRDTVNYQRVQRLISDYIHEKKHILIEPMASEIVTLLFGNFQKIEAVKIVVKKPHALNNTRYTAVHLFRKRSS